MATILVENIVKDSLEYYKKIGNGKSDGTEYTDYNSQVCEDN